MTWAELLRDADAREPFQGAYEAHSPIERVRLRDGRVVLVKRMSAEWDLTMQITGDDGRLHRLWSAGLFARMPASIEHGILAVERDDGGWRVVMNDLSTALLADDRVLTRAEHRRILQAAAELHRAFWEETLPPLCPLTVHYTFLGPNGIRGLSGNQPFGRMVHRGWELFPDLVPTDVSKAIHAIHEHPERLVSALERCGRTLIHGDFRFANLGLLPERVAILDWGPFTAFAPPAVDFAYYLIIGWSRIAATREEIIEDFRASEADRFEERALGLALIGALAQLGWNKALDSAEHPDPLIRARERADLDWWIGTVRRQLERWAPF